MPHIPTRFMSTAPRAEVSPTSKPSVPYLGSRKGETNPATQKSKLKSTLLSRLDPFKYEVDPLRVLETMQRVSGLPKRKYRVDEHTRGLVRDDNTTV
jgi:hypothetical protein